MNRLYFSYGAGLISALILLSGCAGQSTGALPPAQLSAGAASDAAERIYGSRGAIQHIVIIIQENRTVDNLFNGLPGADTVNAGKNMSGETIELKPISLTAPYDMSHRHGAWQNDYNGGAMNGFSTEPENCHSPGHCPPDETASYGYVQRTQTWQYWEMAQSFTFADKLFQSNQGPSFPAHQYLISGTSTIGDHSKLKASDNPGDTDGISKQGGCDSVKSTRVKTIDPAGNEGKLVFPCFERKSIMDLMNKNGISWTYYQESGGAGQFHAVDAIKQIRYGPSYDNVKWPSAEILRDIHKGRLAQVVFVTPSAKASDHPASNNGSGPSWVASVVNAIGNSQYWRSTAIVVTWDDWGGWYDHVKPPVYNSFELGFRVPMIVISPYARRKYVSHTQYEFGSILKFVEDTFSLGSLGTTDVRATSIADCFKFDSKATAFTPIRTNLPPGYFERLPVSSDPVDDDR